MSDTEYLMSNKTNREQLMKSIEQHKGSEEEENTEIPPMLLTNLIEWMRNKGMDMSIFIQLNAGHYR
ncbi:MAG: hypothetical protein J6C99_05125 [Lachnospiraceae bacterium]|nr:hypothetical protein [Lachnospiraceae bacterium]